MQPFALLIVIDHSESFLNLQDKHFLFILCWRVSGSDCSDYLAEKCLLTKLTQISQIFEVSSRLLAL